MQTVPISEKYTLTIKEAAAYFNIGEKQFRSLSELYRESAVLLVGKKVLIKREKFERLLDGMDAVSLP